MKVDRLFSIVDILINKKVVTAPELAEKFNVSTRTIYRDIEVLCESGIPIYCTVPFMVYPFYGTVNIRFTS